IARVAAVFRLGGLFQHHDPGGARLARGDRRLEGRAAAADHDDVAGLDARHRGLLLCKDADLIHLPHCKRNDATIRPRRSRAASRAPTETCYGTLDPSGSRGALAIISAVRCGKIGLTGGRDLRLIWPWQDRARRFSWLKASALALILAPGIRFTYHVAIGDYGIFPIALGGMVYWSGVWATVVLLMALAVTPALT